MGVVSCIIAMGSGDQPAAPVLSAEQRAKKEAEERQFQAVVGVLRAIKRGAKDPESVQFEEVGLVGGKVVCATARGKNSFGASTLQQFAYQLDGKPLDYGKDCAGKSAEDMKHARRAM